MDLNLVFCFALLVVPTYCSLPIFDYFGVDFDVIRSEIDEILEESKIDDICVKDIKTLISEAFGFNTWALKMLDASGKINSGLFEGNFYQIGHYEECLSVEQDINGRVISGQYCKASLLPNPNYKYVNETFWNIDNLPKFLEWSKTDHFSKNYLEHFYFALGICLPKSCSPYNLEIVWEHVNEKYHTPVRVTFQDISCYYKGKPIGFTAVDFYIFIFFGFIVFLVATSTFYDTYIPHVKNPRSSIYVSFSLFTNINKLLCIKRNNDDLTCIYGIKVLCMMWIIVGHITLVKSFMPNINTISFTTEWKHNLGNAAILAATLGVDTFFVLSGILAVYVQLVYSEKVTVSFLSVYFHRFFRLAPSLLVVILCYIGVIKYLGEGPLWSLTFLNMIKPCQRNWWATLFFVGNLIDDKHLCVNQAWFLTTDMQLHILGPFIVFYIYKYPKTVFASMIGGTLVSIIYSFYVVFQQQLGFVMLFEMKNIDAIYFSTLCRLPTWLVGAYCGYLIFDHRKKNLQILSIHHQILWILSLISILGMIFYHHIYVALEYSALRVGILYTFGKLTWAFGICGIIYNCSMNHGKLINIFLSHPIFIVLGKLTYTIYLVELGVIYFVAFTQHESGYLGTFEILHEFCGDFVIILFYSLMLYLCVEAPINSLMTLRNNNKNMEKLDKVDRDL